MAELSRPLCALDWNTPYVSLTPRNEFFPPTLISITVEFRIGIFPLSVNKCVFTDELSPHGAVEVSFQSAQPTKWSFYRTRYRLESYAKIDFNLFKTGHTPHKLRSAEQCSAQQKHNCKHLHVYRDMIIVLKITRNSVIACRALPCWLQFNRELTQQRRQRQPKLNVTWKSTFVKCWLFCDYSFFLARILHCWQSKLQMDW